VSLYSIHVLPKMDTSFDPDNDLSTAFGPETLAEIYAAATFLNPTKRLAHFEKQWTGELACWIKPMENHCPRVVGTRISRKERRAT
jgi:hypothetical protein